MVKNSNDNKELKQLVGKTAAALVQDGMVCGLGTGSTVAYLLYELGQRILNEGLKITGVPTSFQSKLLCQKYGIATLDPEDCAHLDLAIDGADEVDPEFNLIKGGGAAQTREKIVAAMADEFVVIVDNSKIVSRLGDAFPVPVEVIPAGLKYVTKVIEKLGGTPQLRMGLRKDGPVITDNGQLLLDVTFASRVDLKKFDEILHQTPGVVETGLFFNLAKQVLVGAGNQVEKMVRLKP